MSSTATSLPKWDVFLSFRGYDTRHNFISFLYRELVRWDIRTFKDDEELESGKQIAQELKRAIGESKFAVVVVSVNYAASPWCLNELVKIMELESKKSITVIPIFYCVDPAQLRRHTGKVVKQFKKHEGREEYRDKLESWKQALTNLANISGYKYSPREDESELVGKIADRISKKLDTLRSKGRNLEGIDKHMKALNLLMELNSNKNVKIVGIWATGCEERSALAKFVYQKIYQEFDSRCFLGSVKMISKGRHLSHLNEEFQRRIQGRYWSKRSLKCQKVLLVADDVNTPDQLGALEEEYNNFGPGSVVIITSQYKDLLLSSGIEYAYEVGHLTFRNVGERFPLAALKQTDFFAASESDYFGCQRDTSGAYSYEIC